MFGRKAEKIPTAEDRYYADRQASTRRMRAATDHWLTTGDNSRVDAERARHGEAVGKVIAYQLSPQGRREARRQRKQRKNG